MVRYHEVAFGSFQLRLEVGGAMPDVAYLAGWLQERTRSEVKQPRKPEEVLPWLAKQVEEQWPGRSYEISMGHPNRLGRIVVTGASASKSVLH